MNEEVIKLLNEAKKGFNFQYLNSKAMDKLIKAIKLLAQKSQPDQDTLGPCLTCGAEDGKPCYRGCGRDK